MSRSNKVYPQQRTARSKGRGRERAAKSDDDALLFEGDFDDALDMSSLEADIGADMDINLDAELYEGLDAVGGVPVGRLSPRKQNDGISSNNEDDNAFVVDDDDEDYEDVDEDEVTFVSQDGIGMGTGAGGGGSVGIGGRRMNAAPDPRVLQQIRKMKQRLLQYEKGFAKLKKKSKEDKQQIRNLGLQIEDLREEVMVSLQKIAGDRYLLSSSANPLILDPSIIRLQR